ncbi:MAG: DJ-1/PfpI family protein [Anaerolineae bacterium]
MRPHWKQELVCLALVGLLAVGCGGLGVEPTATPARPSPTHVRTTPTSIPSTAAPMARLDGRRALFVIYRRFEDNEYGVTRAILEELGVAATVASLTTDVVEGMAGTEVQPDAVLADVHGADYDAVIFVGGRGYQLDDPEGQRIAREAVAEGRVVAAICIAPLTLARAGVVEGKRVTTAVEPDVMEAAGATVTFAGVERDGNIITANSPGGARRFGEMIAVALGE